jgi:hypothetical protein
MRWPFRFPHSPSAGLSQLGAGFEFPLWRAYILPSGDELAVVLDRIIFFSDCRESGRRCSLCQLPLMTGVDGEFCTAGCEPNSLPSWERATHQYWGAFTSFELSQTVEVAAALEDQRCEAERRNLEEQAHFKHTQWLRALGAGYNAEAAAAPRPAYWLKVILPAEYVLHDKDGLRGPRVVLCRPNPFTDSSWDELRSWPLSYPSSLQAHQGGAKRERDLASIAAAQIELQERTDSAFIAAAEERGVEAFASENAFDLCGTAAALNRAGGAVG